MSYSPAFASESGRTLEISGTALFVPHRFALPEPDGTPLAGLTVGLSDGAPVLYGRGAAGWTALSGGPVPTDSPVPWKATLDFGSGTVAYELGGVAFSPKTALPAGASQVSRVSFHGKGSIGSFGGVYAKVVEQIEIKRPVFSGGGSSPGFDEDGNFVVSVGEMAAGLYYTAFACETVDGDYAASAPSVLADGETASFAIPVGDAPSLFVKIVASDHPFEAGAPFPETAK